MSKLVWGQDDQKQYESGVDRGVLYPSTGPGVVWNGLVNIEEAFSGGERDLHYFDGIKYLETMSAKSYQATITAFSYPVEFGACIGEKAVIPGFVLTKQPREMFGLSYRTLINGGEGYKIHIVYNATASPGNRKASTLSPQQSVETMSWTVDAVPVLTDSYRPSAHYVIDSRNTNSEALAFVETILYGSLIEPARLLTIDELLETVALWSPVFVFIDVVDGLNPHILLNEDIVDGYDRQVLYYKFMDLGSAQDELDGGGVTNVNVDGIGHLLSGVGEFYPTKIDGILKQLPTSRLKKHPTLVGFYRME